MTENHPRETEETDVRTLDKRSYEPPKIESVQLTPEAAEALT